MTLLDGGLIGVVVLLVSGVVAVIWRLLSDEDGDGHPDGPWPRWTPRDRR
jgi:hypothetical protein